MGGHEIWGSSIHDDCIHIPTSDARILCNANKTAWIEIVEYETSRTMGSLAELPHGSSPNLALVHPTKEELLIQFKLNGAEWRGALSLEAYLRREDVLARQDYTKDGGISYWILIDKSASTNPLDPASSARLPLASCETYRKKALVWKDGELKEIITHGIGSVYCAPHLRGRKYAQRMMQEVGEVLRTYQTDEKTDCMFSVLFSDIGKVSRSFYFFLT